LFDASGISYLSGKKSYIGVKLIEGKNTFIADCEHSSWVFKAVLV